ncbi:hypothetical protein SAMN04487792_1613 [Lactobacillus bombicola]|uniref:Uncharacterized protein n=1 Tax=Lactobacillus bombicola TaxID=1505723 RepID=A0A1I1TTX8_9LACO|nr:hypothetical protein [Lactobacillus bombicola]SFD62032.1 hypothetical protein SAMN04487792_1613 [Lactobacillus bombicola]
MVRVRFTILKSEFEEATRYCKANLSMPLQNQDKFVGKMLLWFAHQELWLEKQDNKEHKKFGVIKYPKLLFSDSYVIETDLKLTLYQNMMHDLQLNYPNLVNDNNKSITAFLAHLGYVFIKKASQGKADSGIVEAAKNISAIYST